MKESNYLMPTDEFPSLRAAIEGLGTTHEERRRKLNVNSKKHVQRILKRLPGPLAPFVKSEAAPILLRALLADIEQQANQ